MPQDTNHHANSITGQVVAGCIVAAIGFLAAWLVTTLTDAQASVWWYVGCLFAAGAVATAIYTPWRHRTWSALGRWRPFTTTTTLDALRQSGRDEALAEVAAHRAEAGKIAPQWTAIEAYQGDETVVQIRVTNLEASGPIRDVQINESGVGFTFTGGTFAAGQFPGHAAFPGKPTAGGRLYGVEFDLFWVDVNGDTKYGTALLPKTPRISTW